MSRDDDFSGDGAVDPRLNELLSGYREFLDEVPAGESMPEDVALNIREAIAREPMPSPSSTTTPVNRSMLALAASVAVIGIGIGATVIVTNQPDVQQEPIRASAVDDGSAGDDGGDCAAVWLDVVDGGDLRAAGHGGAAGGGRRD